MGNGTKASGFSLRCVRNNCSSPPLSPIPGIPTALPTQIIWRWNPVPDALGYKWSTINDSTTGIDLDTNCTKTETGLSWNTQYIRYVWAYNNCGYSLEPTTLICNTSSSLYIGQNYGGGIIFYLDATGQHGLISSTSNQSLGTEWGCFGIAINGTSTSVGSGQYNTTQIVNNCSTAGIAARICSDLVLNGYDDWFLPSKDELELMYNQRNIIGGLGNNYYWSSSEYNYKFAWGKVFGENRWSNDYKHATYYMVRAIRAF
jgi:hypothetical protein